MNIGIIEIVVIFLGVGIMVVLFFLISLIQSLTRTSKELETTLKDTKELIAKLSIIADKTNEELNKIGDITEHTIEVLSSLSKTLSFVNKKLLVPSFGALSLISGIKFGFDLFSKKKKKNK